MLKKFVQQSFNHNDSPINYIDRFLSILQFSVPDTL